MSLPVEPARLTTPIADTSYRNYDGPLQRGGPRWWIIARMMVRNAFSRRPFWVLGFMCVLPYLKTGFGMYLLDQMQRLPTGVGQFLQKPTYAGYFYDAFGGFGGAEFWLYLLALLVGAGSIAGDNRANALQIYLSKPITRGDYLLGKWLGIFVPVAAASALPAVILYVYGLISFHENGFFSQERDLPLRVLACTLAPAVLHSSLLTGISAWMKRPVMAGGIYAAIYSGSTVVAQILGVLFMRRDEDLARTLGALSPPGALVGLAKHLYGHEDTIFGFFIPNRQADPGRPDLWPLLALLLLCCFGGVVLARMRVRAVEVIQG